MRYKLIAVVSQDGFIARYSGHKPFEWSSPEEQLQFRIDIENCNWGAMGRNTHEMTYNKHRSRIIFTSSVSKIIKRNNHIFFNPKIDNFSNIQSYFKSNENIAILGGTKVHDFFWEQKLITDIILTIEPIFFENGLLLFSYIKWSRFDEEMKKNSFYLKKEKKFLNNKGTTYIHYAQ